MTPLPAALAPPVAVGGVGGSGTRLVVNLLRAAGLHTGDDLNEASDTLWFTLLFKRSDILRCDDAEFDALTRILGDALAGTARFDDDDCRRLRTLASHDRLSQHTARWLAERVETLIAAGTGENPPTLTRRWGWKEPNTHIVIERLWQRLPSLRYVHVVRHGLEMAYSSNQNQLVFWGDEVLGSQGPVTPERSLAYWCRVHARMQRLLDTNAHRMFWLDYDALCHDPAPQVDALCRFLGCDTGDLAPVLAEVHAPTPSRYLGRDLAGFDPRDLAFVTALGYPVPGR